MRLFVAINFNNDTRAQLIRIRDELRSRSERGNFSLPENLHLTLAFLGECDILQTSAAKAAMDSIRFDPFPITVERIGNFRGELWWVGLKLTPQLSRLQQELSDTLNSKGFILESRRFRPHITIGREIVLYARPWNIELFGETVDTIDLMKSEHINGRLTYTKIHSKESV